MGAGSFSSIRLPLKEDTGDEHDDCWTTKREKIVSNTRSDCSNNTGIAAVFPRNSGRSTWNHPGDNHP